MINVDLTPLLQPIAELGKQAVIDSALPESIVIPAGAGKKSSWVPLIILGIALIAVGVGVYYLTCSDGEQAKLTYDGKRATLTKDGPILDADSEEIEEDDESNS